MTPFLQDNGTTLYNGHVLDVLRELPSDSVHCCATSPPYWALRDYKIPPQVWGGDPACDHEWGEWHEHHDEREANSHGKTRTTDRCYGDESRRFDGNHQKQVAGSFCQKCSAWLGCYGLEPTPELYVQHTVEIFREVRRVLRSDGILWLNLGDCYATGAGSSRNPGGRCYGKQNPIMDLAGFPETQPNRMPIEGLKAKDLVGIPWRVAFALQADGWFLRAALPWVKRSAMPDSATDRPGSAVEYVFLLTPSARYFYDSFAVAREAAGVSGGACFGSQDKGADGEFEQSRKLESKAERAQYDAIRNFRNSDLFFESIDKPHGLVTDDDGWPIGLDVTTQAFKKAHFATFPVKLVEPLLRAGTSEHGVCAKCGAPWERIVEKVFVPQQDCVSDESRERRNMDESSGWTGVKRGTSAVRTNGEYAGKHATTDKQAAERRLLKNVKAAREAGGDHDNPFPQPKTVGWETGCKCNGEIVPGTVIDPFAGSGTVLKVARKLGLKSIGIELSEEYCKIAAARLRERSLFV